jgi:hypothetical protein
MRGENEEGDTCLAVAANGSPAQLWPCGEKTIVLESIR